MANDCQAPEFAEVEAAKPSFSQSLSQNLRRILLGTLRLRRVQVALVTILVTLLIFCFPMLEGLREQLLMLFAAFLMVALGGYTVNDALSNGQEEPSQEHLEELLEDLVEELQQERAEEEKEGLLDDSQA